MRVRTRALMAALVLTAMAVLPGCVGVSWHLHLSSQTDRQAVRMDGELGVHPVLPAHLLVPKEPLPLFNRAWNDQVEEVDGVLRPRGFGHSRAAQLTTPLRSGAGGAASSCANSVTLSGLITAVGYHRSWL